MGEINEMTWQDIVKVAKSKGYDPTKDEKVMSNRNSIMGEASKERLEKEKALARLSVLEGEIETLTGKLTEQEKTVKAKEKELSEFTSKFENFEEIEKKAKSWEEYTNKKQAEIDKKFDEKLKDWKKRDPKSLEFLPDNYEDSKEVTLKLMEKLEAKLFDGKSRADLNSPPSETPEVSPKAAEMARERGISPELASKLLKKQQKSETKE